MRPAPKSLILDLLSSLRGRPMPVRALVAAADVFGISPESIRVALVRLCGAGTVERNERGHYRLAAAAAPVQRHVAAWTRTEERIVPWRGGWIGVHTAGAAGADRARGRRRDRALHFLGFRRLAAHLFVRPDNLKGGVPAVRDELRALGLDAGAVVFGITGLDPATDARARGLWDAAALRRGYRATCAALARSAARLAQLPEREAMVESFVLGGRAIRQLVLDPLLPEPIVPARERAALVDAMRAYDRLGRARWRGFMRAHGAPHLEAPRSAVAARWPTRAGAVA
ncbi:MAG TPA: PaaX family transcriptional regulator [Candidatus Binatia bacterium]|nr:PaaX family transcriptional regulator [Candidatus Binatia bacterium]